MPAATLTPVNRVAGTSLADAFGPVAPGEEWSIDVRATNLTGSDSSADLYLVDTNVSPGASGYRVKAYTVKANDSRDIEQRLVLPTGWKLQDKAPAVSTIQMSYTGTKRSV